MKRFIILYLLIILLLILIIVLPAEQPSKEILPANFSARAFDHIVHLSQLGHRQVGAKNDRLAITYITDQFEQMELDVVVQPFEFESFEYTNVDLKVGNQRFDVIGLGFNPYENKRKYVGKALLIDLNDSTIPFSPEEIAGQTVITNIWRGHFRLLRFKPELIIYVDFDVFDEMKSHGELHFKLEIEGEYKKYRSANIIGKVGNGETSTDGEWSLNGKLSSKGKLSTKGSLSPNVNSSAKEFLITAHFDTYRQDNPGASDNASGVGVLLELARHFKEIEDDLDCVVKFVAFGAEEIGIIGSRNYLYNNTQSLRRCELLFNIDDVGGNRSVVVEMTGGVSGIPETKCVSQIPKRIMAYPWEGVESYWRMLPDDDLMKIFAASNHPDWLVDVINKSVDELGYVIQPTGTHGSDQLAFAQAGIVTSGIGIISANSHTTQDIPEKINKKSLKIAGEITAHVVLGAIERLK
jgi:hypothetical protein